MTWLLPTKTPPSRLLRIECQPVDSELPRGRFLLLGSIRERRNPLSVMSHQLKLRVFLPFKYRKHIIQALTRFCFGHLWNILLQNVDQFLLHQTTQREQAYDQLMIILPIWLETKQKVVNIFSHADCIHMLKTKCNLLTCHKFSRLKESEIVCWGSRPTSVQNSLQEKKYKHT